MYIPHHPHLRISYSVEETLQNYKFNSGKRNKEMKFFFRNFRLFDNQDDTHEIPV